MRRLIVLATMAAALVAAGPASAKTPSNFARVLGPVHSEGDTARLHVRYACDSGDHLWVSAKQTATGAEDPAITEEGTGFGGIAASWLQSHRGTTTCDGQAHQGWFTVDKVEPGSRGQLVKGSAWIQFCITDSAVEENFGLVVVLSEWVKVV
jgi:hypothetical protein